MPRCSEKETLVVFVVVPIVRNMSQRNFVICLVLDTITTVWATLLYGWLVGGALGTLSLAWTLICARRFGK